MDTTKLEQLIEKCQQLKTTSEFERQTHHRIYTEFIKPFLHALSWEIPPTPLFQRGERGDLSLLEVGHFLQLTLKPDVLTLFILGEDFDRRYETTVRTARLETGISAVTNFDRLIVHFRDDSGVKEIENFSSAGYLASLDALQRLFSKESIESGDYLHYITDKLKADFDTGFFDLLLSFRKEIAEGIWAEASNRAMLREAYGDASLPLGTSLEIELNRLVQTIVDRFLIYRFAEDKMLLPQSLSIKERQIQYESGILPSIWKGILYNFDLFRGRYNGKIFDEGMADRITLQNNFLINFVKKLYDVGFSEHRIEVLGHIYEKYLGERVYIKGDKIRLDKTPEARKAGGVYYTPSYITKYIVDNTLGVMLGELEDRLEEVKESGDVDALTEILAEATDIKILDPACGSGAFLIQALKLLRDFYKTYSEVAEEIRKKRPTDNLIDSGELMDKIDPIVYGNDRKSVRLSKAPGYYALQHNIYGVDIDERAVEVTAVSLMMQILDEVKDAPGLKFPAIMEENIKCGNSLISGVTDRKELEEDFKEEIGELIALRKQHKSETDSEKKIWISHTLFNKKRVINLKLNSKLSEYFDDVNAKKPFNWEVEFPEVFFNEDGSLKENPGFDCVVGNPPYFNMQTTPRDFRNYVEKDYSDYYRGKADVHYYFMAAAIALVASESRWSFIVSRYFIESYYADKLWEQLNSSNHILQLIDFGKVKIFQDANVDTCIILSRKTSKKVTHQPIQYGKLLISAENSAFTIQDFLARFHLGESFEPYAIGSIIEQGQLRKAETGEWQLGEICHVGKGAASGNDDVFVIYKATVNQFRIEKNLLMPVVEDSTIDRYHFETRGRYLILTVRGINIHQYPNCLRYLQMHKENIEKRYSVQNEGVKWYEIVRFNTDLFIHPRSQIYCYYRSAHSKFAYSETPYCTLTTSFVITPKSNCNVNFLYILAILNSKYLEASYFKRFGKGMGSVIEYSSTRLNEVPIRRIDFTNPTEKSQHDALAALADKMLHLNKRLHNELEQLSFLQICDLSAVPAQAGEINTSRLPLKEMKDRFRIAITGSKRKKLTPKVIETFEVRDGELYLKDGKLTARIQVEDSACGGDETAISFLQTYLAHIDAETLDTLNAEYPKLDDKIRNLPVPDLTIEEML